MIAEREPPRLEDGLDRTSDMLMLESFTLFGMPIVRWNDLCATERASHS